MSGTVGNGERGRRRIGDRGGVPSRGVPSVFDDVVLEGSAKSNKTRGKGGGGGRGGGFGDFPAGGTFDSVMLEEYGADGSNRTKRTSGGGPATIGRSSGGTGVSPDVLAAFSAFDPIEASEKRRKQREAENASWVAAAAEFSAKSLAPAPTLDRIGDVLDGGSLGADPSLGVGPPINGDVSIKRHQRACQSLSPVPPPNAVYSKSDIGPNTLAEIAIPLIANSGRLPVPGILKGNLAASVKPDFQDQLLQEEDHGPTVPVSIMLRNLYLPLPDPKLGSEAKNLLSMLLPRVQLDIVATVSVSEATGSDAATELHNAEDQHIVVASLPLSSPSPHPKWDRIDEILADSHNFLKLQTSQTKTETAHQSNESANSASIEPSWRIKMKWEVLYERHNVRGRIVAYYPVMSPKAHEDHTNLNRHSPSTVVDPNSCEEWEEGDIPSHRKVVVAEVPIDPSLLRKLPPAPTETPSSVTSGLSVSFGKSASAIPSSLPPNAILVRYNDGSTRVLPDLYQLLRRSGAFDTAGTGKATKRTKIDRGPTHTRSSSAPMATEMSRHESALTSVEPDRMALHDMEDDEETEGMDSFRAERDRLFSDTLFDVLGDDHPKPSESSAVETDETALSHKKHRVKDHDPTRSDDEPSEAQENMPYVTVQPLSDSFQRKRDNEEVAANIPCQQDIELDMEKIEKNPGVTQCDVDFLIEQLRNEEEALRKEEEAVVIEAKKVKKTMEMVRGLQSETDDFKLFAQQESLEAGKLEVILAVRRAKLIRDLESIYPIRQVSRESYSIVGLEVPMDLFGSTITDEEVSAAMGFVCHLVFMCSKYLAVPLRYRLICNSSRSAVQEDGPSGKVYPLFREGRMVDRLQLEHAVTLLDRDVDYILSTQGISFIEDGSTTHILAKLRQLFVQSDSIIGSSIGSRST